MKFYATYRIDEDQQILIAYKDKSIAEKSHEVLGGELVELYTEEHCVETSKSDMWKLQHEIYELKKQIEQKDNVIVGYYNRIKELENTVL